VVANTSETATVAYALANPHKFILANEGGDWLTVKDNSLWGSSKTIYDPCPEGWRVPDGGYNGGLGEDAHPDGIWAKAGFSRQGDTAFGPDDNGRVGKMFGAPFCTPQTWYPAAGSIQYATGQLYGLGVDGVYQSVTAYGGTDTMVTGLLFNYFPTLFGVWTRHINLWTIIPVPNDLRKQSHDNCQHSSYSRYPLWGYFIPSHYFLVLLLFNY
jgi:hypothetical protein